VLLTENYWSTTSNFVFRRSTYDRAGEFRPLHFAHDWDFALRMARLTRLVILAEPLSATVFTIPTRFVRTGPR